MAREIVKWCDVCLADDVRTSATTLRVQLSGDAAQLDGVTRELDLCDEHVKQYASALAAIAVEHGERVDSSKQLTRQQQLALARDTVPRLEQAAASGVRRGRPPQHGGRGQPCLWCSLTYAVGGGLTAHLQNVHGFGGLREAFGSRCPECGDTCQLLGGHMLRRHGYDNVAAAFAALRESDPHGIVAERAADVRKPKQAADAKRKRA